MGADPLQQLVPAGGASGDGENDRFARIDLGGQLGAIEHQKCFERRVTDALIAVDKGMIVDQRERERGGLRRQVRIEVLARERRPRLRHRRFQCTEIA